MLSNFELKQIIAEAIQALVNDDYAALDDFRCRVLKSFEQWKQEKGDRKPRAPSGLINTLLSGPPGGKPIPFKKATPWQCAGLTSPSPIMLAIKLWREDYRPFMEIVRQEGDRKALAMLIVVFGKDSSASDVREAHSILRELKSIEMAISAGADAALQPQKTNLAKGRKDGVLKRQEKAKKKQAVLNSAIKDLFDKPENPGWGWTNDEIVVFLKQRNLGYGYADSSILTVVKREAAKYYKARKEEQACQFQKR